MKRPGAARSAVLVAGMHRSGTSALTRVLNIVGCDLPKTLVRPKRGNVLGFWESQTITDLNEEILASAHSFWEDWRPFSRSWYSSPPAEAFQHRARQLIRDEFGDSRLFVLKDPRLCRLLPFWLQAFDALNVQVHVISPIRSPFDVASSLHARNHIDPFSGLLIWLRHVLDAEHASRSLVRSHLRYELLLSDPHSVIAKVGSDLDISWPNASTSHIETEVEAFLSPTMRHFSSDEQEQLSDPNLSYWIRDSFDILDRWSRGEECDDDDARLDRIRVALDEATPAFSGALAAGQNGLKRSRLLWKDLEKASKKLDASQDRVTQREDRIRILAERLDASRGRVTQREDRIRSLAQRLDDSRRKTARRDGRIRILTEKLGASRDKVADHEKRIHGLVEQLEIARTGHVMTLAHRRTRFGIENLQVHVLLNPEWLEQVLQRPERGMALELRCNGRAVARTTVHELPRNLLRVSPGPRLIPLFGDMLYSIHDPATGESLTALLTPPFRLARRVRGAVESWSPREVRGWAADPDSADRYRRIAIHVNGQLRKVVEADEVRSDPPGHEEGGELRGFRWCCADSRVLKTGTRLDLFDADTGLHLKGSPVRIEDGQVLADTRLRP